MPQQPELDRNVFVATVGSPPLVLEIDNWAPGTIEVITLDGEDLTFDGEELWTVVFNG